MGPFGDSRRIQPAVTNRHLAARRLIGSAVSQVAYNIYHFSDGTSVSGATGETVGLIRY